LPLTSKIQSLFDREKEQNYLPESLPGISRDGDSKNPLGSAAWRTDVYACYSLPPAKEVIDSWYTNFWSPEEAH